APPARGGPRVAGGGVVLFGIRAGRARPSRAVRVHGRPAGGGPVRAVGRAARGDGRREGGGVKQVLLVGGEARLEEGPRPRGEPGALLVRPAWSVLSAGTERAALRAQEASTLLERAADPASLRKALDLLRREGPAALLERVRSAGETPLAPGYAASGFVQAAG